MWKESFRILIFMGLVIGLVIACGDDENGDDGGDQTSMEWSVDPEMLISDMSDDEVQDYCDDVEAFLEADGYNAAYDQWECNLAGSYAADFSQSDPVDACEIAYNSCMDDQEEPHQAECWITDIDRTQCEATAEQMQSCRAENSRDFQTDVEAFSCSEVEDDDEGSGAQEDLGPACAAAFSDCTSLIF